MQALKGASPLRVSVLELEVLLNPCRPPPLWQKPAILVSQVKRLEWLTDSDDAALVNIVGGASTPEWICSELPTSSWMPQKGSHTSGTPSYQLNTSEYKTSKSRGKNFLH